MPDALVAEERRAVRRVAIPRCDAECGQGREGLLEPLALLAERRVLGLVGGGEVRIHGVDREALTFCDLRQRPRQVVMAKTETVHPGVDFQVAAQFLPGLTPV